MLTRQELKAALLQDRAARTYDTADKAQVALHTWRSRACEDLDCRPTELPKMFARSIAAGTILPSVEFLGRLIAACDAYARNSELRENDDPEFWIRCFVSRAEGVGEIYYRMAEILYLVSGDFLDGPYRTDRTVDTIVDVATRLMRGAVRPWTSVVSH